MILILAIIFFIFGLMIGSFLNVVICRMNTARSFGGRSACMSCKNQLCWYELIPVASFLALRGRCRNCKTRISILYPTVELAAGLIFVALFLKFQDAFFMSASIFAVSYAYYTVMFSILVVIAAYDLKHKIIPDSLSMAFGVSAFIGLFFFNGFLAYWHIPSVLDLLSGVLISFPFAILWYVSKGAWMGFGDVKLALGLGWFLGFALALSAVAIAFWTGAIIGLCLMVFRKGYGMKSEIPFAVYLVFGVLLSFIFELHLFIYV